MTRTVLASLAVAAVLSVPASVSAVAHCHLAPYKNYPCSSSVPRESMTLNFGKVEGSAGRPMVGQPHAGTTQQGRKSKQIQDGTSNTMMLSEPRN
jgi:hypothetical protein